MSVSAPLARASAILNSSFLTCREDARIGRWTFRLSQPQKQRMAEDSQHNQSMHGIVSKTTGIEGRLLHLVSAELHPCEIIPLDPELHILWYTGGIPTMQWGGKESQHILFAWALQHKQDFE